MADMAADNQQTGMRWPFRETDSFAGITPEHRPALIRNLPGLIIWPLMMFSLATFTGGFAQAVWVLLNGQITEGDAAAAFFLGGTIGYAITAVLMAFWLGRYHAAAPAFSIIPTHLSDVAAAVLVMVFVLGFGSPLTVMFHEFAMADPEMTLSGGARLEDVSNVDNVVNVQAPRWMIIAFVVFAAPIVEEVIFRGWMLPMLRARGMPTVFAILISALAFGLIHIFHEPSERLMVMTSTFFLGIALGVTRVMTGRTAAPVLGHMANNAWALFVVPAQMGLATA